MTHSILINNRAYPVVEFRSLHFSDTLKGRLALQFSGEAKEKLTVESEDHTVIEFSMENDRIGIVVLPTPIKDVVEYFEMLNEEGDIFKISSDAVIERVQPKSHTTGLHRMFQVTPD